MTLAKPTNKAAALRATRTARAQVAEQIAAEPAAPKPAGVQRMTLVLTAGVARRVEDSIHELRDWRKISFGAFTEAALEDLLARSPEEQKEILERFDARARRKFDA
jgi:hypothetical protein